MRAALKHDGAVATMGALAAAVGRPTQD
jgi:hypothetical protein